MDVGRFVILMAAAAAAVIAAVAYRLSRCRFTCKSCGGVFRISWRRALWVQHFNEDYVLRCPHCGKKGWCTARRRDGGEENTDELSAKL